MGSGANKGQIMFIRVNSATLDVSLRDTPLEDEFSIPAITDWQTLEPPSEFSRVIVYGVLDHYVHEEEGESPEEVQYQLIPPDPWLLAIAAIMWEGLLQGLAWETVKVAVLKALSMFKLNQLAPEDSNVDGNRSLADKRTNLQIGISWSEFSEDGVPLKKLFMGIQREYQKKTESQRITIKKSSFKG